jgi:hypothetical protein
MITSQIRLQRAPLIISTIFTLVACGERGNSDRWEGSVDTLSNGRVVVQNTGRGIWDSTTAWKLKEDLRIGSADAKDEAAFADVRAIQVDDAGNIYVLDAQTSAVKVFDKDGKFVRRIGRPGKGPGELAFPVGLAWNEKGQLYVVDQHNARYALFDRNGKLVKEYPRPRLVAWVGFWTGDIDTRGRMLEPVRGGWPVRDEKIARLDSTFSRADTIPLPPFTPLAYVRENPRMFTSVPFGPTLVRAFDPRHNIWVGLTSAYRLVQLGEKGDTLRIIERKDWAPPHVSEQDKDTVLAALEKRNEYGLRYDRSVIPATKPAFAGFSFDESGAIWIEPYVEQAQGQVFDVFDAEGRYLGRATTTFTVATWPRPVFRNGSLYALTYDENGAPFIVRARIERPGQ